MSFLCFINYLLWIKADLYSCFQGGHSALHYAAFSGSDGIVKLLLSKKADATLTAGVGFLEFARNLTVKVASPFPSPSPIPTPLLCLSGESTRKYSLGSNPQGNAICGLSLLLVLAYVPREYFCEYPSFSLSSIVRANMHFIFGSKIRPTMVQSRCYVLPCVCVVFFPIVSQPEEQLPLHMACSRPSGAVEIVKTLLKPSGKDAKLATDKVIKGDLVKNLSSLNFLDRPTTFKGFCHGSLVQFVSNNNSALCRYGT